LHPVPDTSPAKRDTIRLEDDLSSDVYPTKKKQVIESNYDFSVVCVICGTRLDVNDALIGKKIKCPDCHNAIDVRTPPPERRRAPFHAPPTAFDDDDFGIAKAADTTAFTSPYHSIANDLLAKAESEVARETPKAPRRKIDPTLDSMQRAESELDEADERERPKLPAAPFRTGVMKFLIDPQTIGRLLVLAFVLFVELGAIQWALVTAADENPQSQFFSIIARIIAVILGIAFTTNLAVSLLGILQDTANGMDAIESWPDVNFVDWIGEAFYIFSALFLAVFPACALAKVVSLLGAPDSLFWLVGFVGSFVGILFLFPFVLVSMLESASPIVPVSRPIIRSLRLARGRWLVFTLLSSLVVGSGLGLVAVRGVWSDHAVMNFAIAVFLIVLCAIYFRLLGRLTWCCDEAISAEDLRLEEAVEASEKRD
jgi:DNA-directed RNA polymerase subunit RPC12/RpoP